MRYRGTLKKAPHSKRIDFNVESATVMTRNTIGLRSERFSPIKADSPAESFVDEYRRNKRQGDR